MQIYTFKRFLILSMVLGAAGLIISVYAILFAPIKSMLNYIALAAILTEISAGIALANDVKVRDKYREVMSFIEAKDKKTAVVVLFNETRRAAAFPAELDNETGLVFIHVNRKQKIAFAVAAGDEVYQLGEIPIIIAYRPVGQLLDAEALFAADVLSNANMTRETFNDFIAKRAFEALVRKYIEEGLDEESAVKIAQQKLQLTNNIAALLDKTKINVKHSYITKDGEDGKGKEVNVLYTIDVKKAFEWFNNVATDKISAIQAKAEAKALLDAMKTIKRDRLKTLVDVGALILIAMVTVIVAYVAYSLFLKNPSGAQQAVETARNVTQIVKI